MVRPNASRRSHAELDEATELDDGDPQEFALRWNSRAAPRIARRWRLLRLGHAAHQGSDRGGRLSAGRPGFKGSCGPRRRNRCRGWCSKCRFGPRPEDR